MSFADRTFWRGSKTASSFAKVLFKMSVSMSSSLGSFDLCGLVGNCRVLAKSKKMFG
jgi:hypothetical protein